MFEKYTEKARRVIFFARYEASQYGSREIEPEHLLLGLTRESHHFLNKILNMDVLAGLRAELEPDIKTGPRFSTAVEVPLSPASKRVLNRAFEEADRLGHARVGTQHLLFGILAEQESPAALVLRKHGLTEFSPRRETREIAPARSTGQQEQYGIPGGYGLERLLYNPPTGILIAEVCCTDSEYFLPNRLFWRHKDAERYTPLGEPEETRSQESAVVSTSLPLAFFNSNRIADEESALTEWEGLYAVDLASMAVSPVASKETLPAPAPYTRCWVDDLISISDNGQVLYVTIGARQEPVSKGEELGYYLAELEIASKNIRLVTKLRGSFL